MARASVASLRHGLVVRSVARSIEFILFALALGILLPQPSSAVGRAWETPSKADLAASIAMFVVSLAIATVLKRESAVGLIIKSIVFAAFALGAVSTSQWMGNSINARIAESLNK